MSQQKKTQQLSKLLAYILERRPDEFGLVPDSDGYVKIKDLLKAINEEEGWRHVRLSHLKEIQLTVSDAPFECDEHRIRAKNRQHLPVVVPCPHLPKLLYTSVRTRAYPVVIEKGIFPSGYIQIILSSDRTMAERMGKRSDPEPIVLTVQVQKSLQQGAVFHQAGETLYLADHIPADCFTGPPLPKQKEESEKPKPVPEHRQFPGSFFMDLNRDPQKGSRYEKKKSEKLRDREKNRRRKQKYKGWDEE